MMDQPLSCIDTGATQMDDILHGGFPTNSINIIMGQPGAGKTIFAEQLCFHQAAENGRPVLYITTMSEPVSKVLSYLQRFSFYDENKIGSSVHYRDIGFDLAKSGITALKTHLVELIHELSPKVIVIDSFRALHDLTDSPSDMRTLLFELTGILTAFETTVFLVGEYTDEDWSKMPEFAVADGIVQLLRSNTSTRDERFLRVLKLRGSSYLEGLHGFSITTDGIKVFPRLISPATSAPYEWTKERINSGIEGLDEMIGGGFWQGSSTLLAGPMGSGKTTFALQFAIAAVRQNKGSLYLTFQENPTQLNRTIESLGFTPEELRAGGLQIAYSSPVELQIDSIIVRIFQAMQKQKFHRLVIDAIGDLALAASSEDRLHDYLYALAQHLAQMKVTSMFVWESMGNSLQGTQLNSVRFSNMSDNVISLSTAEEPAFFRRLRCLKARGSAHDLRPRNFEMTEKGITVHAHDAVSLSQT